MQTVDWLQFVDSEINLANLGIVTKWRISHGEKFSAYFVEKMEQIWRVLLLWS